MDMKVIERPATLNHIRVTYDKKKIDVYGAKAAWLAHQISKFGSAAIYNIEFEQKKNPQTEELYFESYTKKDKTEVTEPIYICNNINVGEIDKTQKPDKWLSFESATLTYDVTLKNKLGKIEDVKFDITVNAFRVPNPDKTKKNFVIENLQDSKSSIGITNLLNAVSLKFKDENGKDVPNGKLMLQLEPYKKKDAKADDKPTWIIKGAYALGKKVKAEKPGADEEIPFDIPEEVPAKEAEAKKAGKAKKADPIPLGEPTPEVPKKAPTKKPK